MSDLFGTAASADGYDAANIEVLEGLEPVRHRPGMYIGGTDERALHHLAAEILDNSMDEAVAGHADWIEMTLESRDRLTIRDNGRGMPVGEHPKFPGKSAVEVILTTLHAGGKFGAGGYKVSGGLHGVGVSVVNALSEWVQVTVRRQGQVHQQRFERGAPIGTLASEPQPASENGETGTTVCFKPDIEIFTGGISFDYATLSARLRELAYLNGGVRIVFRDERESARGEDGQPHERGLFL